jgi:uncharacterized protein (TIGR04255 family)
VSKVYNRAPITEAVIEIRTSPIDVAQLERLVARFSRKYPAPHQKLIDFRLQLGEVSSTANQKLSGYRLSALDGSKILMVGMSSIATVKIAPYEGWENLFEDAQDNWKIWLKIIGWRSITRIGVRYVNRIDIPTHERIELTDYLTIQPALPKSLDTGIEHFAMNVVIPLGEDGQRLVLNTGSVASPIIGNQSLILDLDVSREHDLPSDDASLWSAISTIRDKKNEIFEACITDKTRALLT